MPPERKIEKLLRAYAKKRKATGGDAFTLSSANRRRLQEQVAKRVQEDDEVEDSSVSIWDFFRRQWAFLTVFALAIFLGAVLILPVLTLTKGKTRGEPALALKQEQSSLEVADKLSARVPAPATPVLAKMDLKDLPQLAASRSRSTGTNVALGFNEPAGNVYDRTYGAVLAPPAPTTMNYLADNKAPMVTNGITDEGFAGGGGGGAGETFALAPGGLEWKKSDALDKAANFEKAAPILAASGAVLYQNTKDSSEVSNSYKNTSSANAGPVLSRFKVTQRGSDIQIVDEDGSVYNGSWQPLAAQNDAYSLPPNAPAQTIYQNTASLAGLLPAQNQNSAANGVAAQTYLIRVNGDNRTLKQKVVFNGNLSVVYLANVAANNGQAANGNAQNALGTANYFGQNENRRDLGSNNVSVPAAYATSYIVGQATIAGTNQVQVNAVSVAP